MQSYWESFIEAKVNTIMGFCISWFLMAYVIPYIFNIDGITTSNSFNIVALFTIVSVIRSYIIRRIFNHLTLQKYRSINHE